MDQRSRLLLLIPHLGGGGAERVFELLARHLPAEKYDLHLGLVADSGETGNGLPDWVTVHRLGAPRVRDGVSQVLHLVRRLAPDVVLSNMAHLNFLVLLLRPMFPRGTRVLVRQNGTVSLMLADMHRPAPTRALYRLLYPRADAVLCQSDAMARDLRRYAHVPPERIAIVPNPVDIHAIRTREPGFDTLWAGPGPHLLSVGRLVPQKGIDLLLDALALLRRHMPTADLTLAGVGSEEALLREQAYALGLDRAVRFLGFVRGSAAYYSGASAFVLASRQEGMPNALLEAAAGGLPIITTPACGGLVELVQGQPGVWVADAISAPALECALTAAFTAIAPGQRFAHPWIHAFGLEPAIASYETVIDHVLDRSPREVLA